MNTSVRSTFEKEFRDYERNYKNTIGIYPIDFEIAMWAAQWIMDRCLYIADCRDEARDVAQEIRHLKEELS